MAPPVLSPNSCNVAKDADGTLLPHPATPGPAGVAIRAGCALQGTLLKARFTLKVGSSQLRIPPPAAQRRTDGLWRHTCFELFVKPRGGSAYWEFNFSPSGEWAAYRFSDYRRRAAGEAVDDAPAIEAKETQAGLVLTAGVDLAELAPEPQPLRLGLSAVLEDRDGGLSYWALRHPAAEPDFHHPEAFSLELDGWAGP